MNKLQVGEVYCKCIFLLTIQASIAIILYIALNPESVKFPWLPQNIRFPFEYL